ncbi:MAG: ABC transporter ATP-binding protein [Candidatus Aenigmarchaeota archaeon]|nr:ABC transporter ATP-binding protein [Candidatus Aenigmarchaeota archaeon]
MKKYTLGETEVKALDDVSLSINEGEFVSIMGSSGSGKSTLLHIVGALDRPTSGSVRILGRDVHNMNDNELAALRGDTIGFVFQTFNLIPRLSVMENVVIPSYFVGAERNDQAKHLVKSVGLGERIDHMPSQLSGGERQRVAIARALINDPKIIVADEPTGNLDSVNGKKIMDIFKSLNKQGKTVIIVTHDMHIAKFADRIIRIKDGKIVK